MSENTLTVPDAIASENVLTINDYNAPQKSNSFELVMSQMQIADPNDFKYAFSQQWQSAAMANKMISILVCEIDFYQEYVDNYGEQGASFMLISIALTLKNICDTHQCFLARNEQQGFSILIQSDTPQEVQAIAEKLCEAVKNSKTEHKYSKINDYITLSMGSSSVYPTTQTILNNNAVSALNTAKTAGGNKVSDVSDVSEPMSSQMLSEIEENNAIPVAQPGQQRTAQHSAPSASHNHDSTYRDQILEENSGTEEIIAPKSNIIAPSDSEDEVAEPVKAKKAPVRMYRGHVIS